MRTTEDKVISELVKRKLKEAKKTGRDLADALGVSESMVCLLLQSRRKWSPKYLNELHNAKLLDKEEYFTVHKLAARSAGYSV